MKKKIQTMLAIILCAMMAMTAVPATASAAGTKGTIDLQKKIISISGGASSQIRANTVTISKGCKYQVKAVIGGVAIKSNGKWASSKPTVATVSKTGLVTAKAAGVTTVKVTYNGKSQSVKVKVVAICKHIWKTTKKATCEVTGKKICTVCGKNSTVKRAAHKWKTEVNTKRVGVGKPTEKAYFVCNGNCRDGNEIKEYGHSFNDFTGEEAIKYLADHPDGPMFADHEGLTKHRSKSLELYEAGLINYVCGAATFYVIDVYPSYKTVTDTNKYCETCGEQDNPW